MIERWNCGRFLKRFESVRTIQRVELETYVAPTRTAGNGDMRNTKLFHCVCVWLCVFFPSPCVLDALDCGVICLLSVRMFYRMLCVYFVEFLNVLLLVCCACLQIPLFLFLTLVNLSSTCIYIQHVHCNGKYNSKFSKLIV